MYPPILPGDHRRTPNFAPLPDWFVRDQGDRLTDPLPRKRWRLPIWPGLRLELRIMPIKDARHV